MAGAEIHVHDIMIALSQRAGEGIALALALRSSGVRRR